VWCAFFFNSILILLKNKPICLSSATMNDINSTAMWQARLDEAEQAARVELDARMKADVLLDEQKEEINRLRSALMGSGRVGRRVSASRVGKDALRRDVEAFVRTRVTSASDDTFVSTNDLLCAFLSDGFSVSSENMCLFYRTLKTCILREFPTALERRTWRIRGYGGIAVDENV